MGGNWGEQNICCTIQESACISVLYDKLAGRIGLLWALTWKWSLPLRMLLLHWCQFTIVPTAELIVCDNSCDWICHKRLTNRLCEWFTICFSCVRKHLEEEVTKEHKKKTKVKRKTFFYHLARIPAMPKATQVHCLTTIWESPHRNPVAWKSWLLFFFL